MKKKSILTFLVILIFGCAKVFPVEFRFKSNGGKEKSLTENISNHSFAFTENKGQVQGYDGLSHPEVKFLFQHGDMQIFLLEKGLAYQFTKVHYPEGYEQLLNDRKFTENSQKLKALQNQVRTETFRMDMTLLGSNKAAEITKEGRSEDYANYYNHNAFDVYAFSKIIYHDIYPGIDWVIYTKGNEVKYDFILKPGADPSLIKMSFKHQEDICLNKNGSFTLKNRLGFITEKMPESFQGEKKIQTKFILKENTLSFALEKYSANETLVIDPVLIWSTYYGGTVVDYINAGVTDAAGNVYTAGDTKSSTNIAAGGHQNAYGGAFDIFLVKFNAAGQRLWATYYGGVTDDNSLGCAVDPSGNVFVSGSATSTVNIAFAGHQTIYGGGVSDALIMKFNSSGVFQWSSYYGGSSEDFGNACATDASGNVYLSGITSSTANIASGGHQMTFGGGIHDGFLVKFSSVGQRQWATYYGDAGHDDAFYCATDGVGNIYLSGANDSLASLSSGGHQNAFGGVLDAFLVKFNSNGLRQWATYYGGTGRDIGTCCASDLSGNIYLMGRTDSPANIASTGYQSTFGGGNYDAFLVKFSNTGVRQWGTYYGGIGEENSYSAAADVAGNIYLSGFTNSLDSIASEGYQNTYGGGNNDAFLVKFNSAGLRQWGTYYGDAGYEDSYCCFIDGSGNVYLTGETNSNANIAISGHQNSIGGSYDGYLVKFCNNPAKPSFISGNTITCIGDLRIYSVTANPDASTYNWSFSGGLTGSSTTNIINVSTNGNGTITVIPQNACGAGLAEKLSVNVNSCLGIQTLQDNLQAGIYPNPNTGEFKVEVLNETEINIYNSMGQLILSQYLQTGQTEVDLRIQAKGIYFIQLNQYGNTSRAKIIKE